MRFARILDVRRHILYPLIGGGTVVVMGGGGPLCLVSPGQGMDWDILRDGRGLERVDGDGEVITQSGRLVST